MKLATTTGDFNGYAGTVEEKLRLIREAGFRCADMDFTDIGIFMDGGWEDRAKRLREYAEGIGVTFVQAHSPCSGNPVVRDGRWETLMETTRRSFEVCAVLGIPNMVVHHGTRPGMDKKRFFEENLPFTRAFFDVMEKTGVTFCAENSTKANMGDCYWFFDGADMREFIEAADHPLVKACWDTGHANVEGHQYRDITDLGGLLAALHIHDNNGTADEHRLPYSGTANFDEVLCGLIDAGYKGCFTMEATLTGTASHLHRRRTFGGDRRLFETPAVLKLEAEKTLYKIGEYMLRAYGVFEE